jgi:protein OS-9
VDETETCVYTISVQTPRICHHPYLKPPTKTKAVPITCQPLLTAEEYAEYEEMKGWFIKINI